MNHNQGAARLINQEREDGQGAHCDSCMRHSFLSVSRYLFTKIEKIPERLQNLRIIWLNADQIPRRS